MNVFRFKTINHGYKSLVKRLLIKPDYYEKVNIPEKKPKNIYENKNIHVNKKSRFHLRNVHILFENPKEFTKYDVDCPKRTKVMNSYMEKEKELFDRGVINSNEMGNISKLWKLIENVDNTINANYGYMVYHLRDAGNLKYNPNVMMSQWEWCQNRLSKNPNTLQAIMHFNRPKDQYIENLDQPCTVFTQFTVTDGKLNFHSFMRSNDVIYGTPYNIAYFKLLQERMLNYLNETQNLGLEFGYLHHNVTSLHLYEDKIDIAKKIVNLQ